MVGWKDDEEVTKLFEKEDHELIRKLNKVVNLTKTREAKLNLINDKLYKELDNMDSYLIGMNTETLPDPIDLEQLALEMRAIEDSNTEDNRTIVTTTRSLKSVGKSSVQTTTSRNTEEAFYILPYYFTKIH